MPEKALRILIVEDDPVSAMLLETLIEAEGHHICGVAADSESAVQALETLAPDVVFMDLYLKDGVQGLMLTRHITEKHGLPVLITSAASEQEILEGVSESGALSFIQKPIRLVPLRVNLRIAMYHHMLQKDLAASERRYRNIFNNAVMGIYVSNLEGRYQTCNSAFASMLGYAEPEELLQWMISQDEQLYDGPNRRQELLALLREQGEVRGFVSKVYGRDGNMLWISEHCTAILDEEGRMTGYEGFVVDITARKRAEEDFQTTYNLTRTTIESLHTGIAVTDLYGYLIMSNAAAARMVGRPLAPGNLIEFTGIDGESPFALFKRNFAPGTGVTRFFPDAPPVRCEIVPYRNADNLVIGAVHVLWDMEADAG